MENQQRQYGICYMEITENGNTKSLKKATGLRDRELNAAIGWLACEGKIQFDESMQGQNTALYIELSYYIG